MRSRAAEPGSQSLLVVTGLKSISVRVQPMKYSKSGPAVLGFHGNPMLRVLLLNSRE